MQSNSLRRNRRLDRACRTLRWIVPAGAAGWLLAPPAVGQTYDAKVSDIQITHTAGIGALGVITNPPYLTVDVPGVFGGGYVAPVGTTAAPFAIFTPPINAGTYQLVNTFTNPTPWSGGYTFPTGGPQSSTAIAGVGELGGGGGNTSVTLSAGTGITQTNPNGAYAYASQLTISVVNLVYATPSGFPSPTGGFPTITYAFPVGGTLPANSSANFTANLTYTYYATNSGTNTFSPATFVGTPQSIGSINLIDTFTNTSPSHTLSFSAGNVGAILLNGGNNLTSAGYMDVTGTIFMQTLVDSQDTNAGPSGPSSAGLTNNSTPGVNFFLPTDATATVAAAAGHGFAATGNTTDLSQSFAWLDVTPAQGQPPQSGPPGTADLAQFAGGIITQPTTFDLNAPTSWDGISVLNPGAAVDIASGTGNSVLTIGQFGITIGNDADGLSQDLAISSPVAAGAPQTWSVVNGHALAINGPTLALGNNAVTITGGGDVNIVSQISGAGARLIQNGPGTLALAGSNTYGGGTILNGGEIAVTSDANLGGAASALTFNGGILRVGGTTLTNLNGHAVNWQSFSGGFDIVSASNTFTLSNNIGNAATNSGTLTKLGAGTLVLAGNNTYFGPTIIDGGVLQVGSLAPLNVTNILNRQSEIDINSPLGLALIDGVALSNSIVVNTGGEFVNLPLATDHATLAGNITANPASPFNLGFPGGSALATLTLTGTNASAPNQPAAITEGNIVFAGNGSLTVNPGAAPLPLGTTAATLNLTLMNHAAITNTGPGGALLNNNQGSPGVTLVLKNQASLNVGPGMFDVNSTTLNGVANTVNVNGGNLTLGGFSYSPKAPVPGTDSANITINGGVITAAASNGNFFPNVTNLAFSIGSGGAVINTNGFDITAAATLQNGGAGGGLAKNGVGVLQLSAPNGNAYKGATVVNGGLLDITTSSQLGTSAYLQVNAGGAAGMDVVDGASFSDFQANFYAALQRAPVSQSGGLAITSVMGQSTYDFTGNTAGAIDMTNSHGSLGFTNMSIGATTAGGMANLVGTIIPGTNALSGVTTYQLGGGGTLKLSTVTNGPNPGAGTPLIDGSTGSSNVLIENGGTVWLSTLNTYTGSTTIQGTNVLTIPAANSPTGADQFQLETTTLMVSNLDDSASSIGNSVVTNPANLVINGGTLQYVGAGDLSDRLFTIGQMGATVDSSGSGALTLNNMGGEAFAAGVSGPISFTLAGNQSGGFSNTFSSGLIAPAGVTLGLVKTGTNIWTLAGANSFASVSVNGGTLILQGPSADTTLGGTLTPVNITAGATLDIFPTGVTSVSTLTGGGVVDNSFSSAANLTVGAGDASSTFNGVIQNSQGVVSLTATGAGNFTLGGSDNTYGGGTTINAGSTLTLAGGTGGMTTAIVVGTGAMTNNGSLLINRPDAALMIANDISGTGSLTSAGSGTITLTGSNSYTGPTNINAGTVKIGGSNALGVGTVTIAAGAVLDLNGSSANVNGLSGLGTVDNLMAGATATLNYSGSGTTTFGGSIHSTAGVVSVVKNGPGVLALTGNNTYNGSTMVNAGTLQVEGDSPTGSGTVVLSPGATLTGTATIGGTVIAQGGTIIPGDGGAGTLSMDSLNTVPGSSFVFDFAVSANTADSTNSIAVANGVNFNGFNPVYLYLQGTSYGFSTPGTYTLFQVANGSAGTGGLAIANPQPMTSYTLTADMSDSGIGADIDVIVQNTAPVYSFDYNAGGTTLDQNSNPIVGHLNGDLTGATNWYNLSMGAPQLVGHGPGATDIAQFDSSLGNLTASTNFDLSSNQTTSLGGLAVVNPGPAQYIPSGSTMAVPLVMTIGGSGNAGLAIGARGISVAGTDTVISAPVTLTANQTWNIAAVNPVINGAATASQSLTLGGSLNLGGLGGNALILSGNGNATISGTISDGGGSSGITTAPNYSGTLTLGGVNGYTGGTNLAGGTVSIADPSGLGFAGSAVNFQGGTLQVTLGGAADLNSYNVNGAGSGPNATWANFPLKLDVNNLNGTFTVSQNLTGNLSLTKSGDGTLILSGSNTYSGGTTINAGILEVPTLDSLGTGPVIDGGGTLELTANDSPGQSVVNNGTLAMTGNTTIGSISGTGTASVAGNVTFYTDGFVQHGLVNNGTTTIGCGGTVAAISGTGSLTVGTNVMIGNLVMNVNSGLSQQSSVSIYPGSRIDLTNNALAINYGSPAGESAAVSGAVAMLEAGFTGGNWTSAGLTSSMAAAHPGVFSIGYADGNVDVGTPAGANQIMIVYTLAGDADLDGTVGFTDLVSLAQNFGFTGKDWSQGNFVYNPTGSIGFADLVLLAQNFGSSTAVADLPNHGLNVVGLSAAWIATTTAVPEPGAVVLAAASLGLLGRRRRRVR